MAREVAAAGHMIANHTWSHVDLAVLTAGHDRRPDQPRHRRDPHGDRPGADPVPRPLRRLVPGRPPALRAGRDDPARLVRRPSGLVPPRRGLIVGNIMRNTKTGSIILEHDGGGNRSQTVAALKIVLPRLLAAGYQFTTPNPLASPCGQRTWRGLTATLTQVRAVAQLG